MRLTILSVDHAPEELHERCPIEIDLIREVRGPDRPDYWLGKVRRPIRWLDDNREKNITHVVLAARHQGTRIEAGVERLPVGIAFVTDEAALVEADLDLAKCRYVAIGIACDLPDGNDVVSDVVEIAVDDQPVD